MINPRKNKILRTIKLNIFSSQRGIFVHIFNKTLARSACISNQRPSKLSYIKINIYILEIMRGKSGSCIYSQGLFEAGSGSITHHITGNERRRRPTRVEREIQQKQYLNQKRMKYAK